MKEIEKDLLGKVIEKLERRKCAILQKRDQAWKKLSATLERVAKCKKKEVELLLNLLDNR